MQKTRWTLTSPFGLGWNHWGRFLIAGGILQVGKRHARHVGIQSAKDETELTPVSNI